MAENVSSKRLKVSNFKLNALLDITQAINENSGIQLLLKRYENILRKELNIGKILIFKFNEKWDCILTAGIKDYSYKNIDIERDLAQYKEITHISTSRTHVLEGIDIVIPVITNNKQGAFVLIGDIEEESAGVSPVIKHLNFIQTLSNIIIVAIENIRFFNESLRQEALKKELELASRIQSMLIPSNSMLPNTKDFHVTSFYYPHFDVGGDYYDFIDLGKDEYGFCIADVSGKGISASLLMANFQANLRALFTEEISLLALLERLNKRVMESTNGERFITIFIARYSTRTRELEYINAGHNPPMFYDMKTQKLQMLEAGCVGMGMVDDIPVIKRGFISVDNPAKLLCYTDGIVEFIERKKITHDTKVLETLLSNAESIEENINTIILHNNIEKGNTAIFDDISMLGIQFM